MGKENFVLNQQGFQNTYWGHKLVQVSKYNYIISWLFWPGIQVASYLLLPCQREEASFLIKQV